MLEENVCRMVGFAVCRKPHPNYVIGFSECDSFESMLAATPPAVSVPISTLNVKGRDGAWNMREESIEETREVFAAGQHYQVFMHRSRSSVQTVPIRRTPIIICSEMTALRRCPSLINPSCAN